MDDDHAERVLLAASGGDHAPLAEALESWRARLARTVELRLDPRLRGRAEPEDVLQEAFAQVLTRVPEYLERREVALFVWVRFLVLQCLTDAHRKHLGARRRDVRLERGAVPEASSIAAASAFLAGGPSPSVAMALEDRRARLTQALESLQPDDRDMLYMRHLEGLSNKEVAETLGLSEAAASARNARALLRLRPAIEAHGLTSAELSL